MDIAGLKRYLRKDSPRWVILLIDIFIVLCCYYFSNFVIGSFNGNFDVALMMRKSLSVAGIYGICFVVFGTYRGIVRQTGFRDAWQILKAVFVANDRWGFVVYCSGCRSGWIDGYAVFPVLLRRVVYACGFHHRVFGRGARVL